LPLATSFIPETLYEIPNLAFEKENIHQLLHPFILRTENDFGVHPLKVDTKLRNKKNNPLPKAPTIPLIETTQF